jgi:hypothetical protein
MIGWTTLISSPLVVCIALTLTLATNSSLADETGMSEDDFFRQVCSLTAEVGGEMLIEAGSGSVPSTSTRAYSTIFAMYEKLVDGMYPADPDAAQAAARNAAEVVRRFFVNTEEYMSPRLASEFYFMMCMRRKRDNIMLTASETLSPMIGQRCESTEDDELWACFDTAAKDAYQIMVETMKDNGYSEDEIDRLSEPSH